MVMKSGGGGGVVVGVVGSGGGGRESIASSCAARSGWFSLRAYCALINQYDTRHNIHNYKSTDGKQFIIKQGNATIAIVDEVKQARHKAIENAASIDAEARTARSEANNNAECSDTIVS